jgi:UDP-GlcNAc:undecaprenyl-phosphate GlcNAc-1-phosphate transferase
LLEHLPVLALLFLVACLGALAAVRLSIRLSWTFDILDRPDPRKVQAAPVPYLGGLGMLLGAMPAIVLLALLRPDILPTQLNTILLIVFGSVAIYLVGFWDDVRPLRAVTKLLLQILVAGMMWWGGIRVTQIAMGDDWLANIGLWISAVITIGWYVALMNSVNLVDGLDGLAGGICFLGALSLVGVGLVFGYSHEIYIGAALAAIVAGVTLGYLRYNWHPAKTFMGDGGSLLLGFLLATSSMIGSTKTPTLLALSVPLIALGLPLFETSFSFLRRLLRGQHPFKPDRRHLHHRLLDLGLDQQRVVILLLFLTAILGLNAVILAQTGQRILFVNVLLLLAGIVLLIENLKFLERRRDSISSTVVPAPAKNPNEGASAHAAQGTRSSH